ncbi:alpha/beta-hydrolase [Trametopsis cervina]|nr:alpha/beta-hydrolase [Trametopsis cervina]
MVHSDTNISCGSGRKDIYLPFSDEKPKHTNLSAPIGFLRTTETAVQSLLRVALLVASVSTLWYILRLQRESPPSRDDTTSDSLDFFHNVTQPRGICVSPTGHDVSYAGFIGLNGDTDVTPKRSFFWFFEAEQNSQNAPTILAIGGGPGTSGLMTGIFGQWPCTMSSNGTIPNPHRWTEHYNLLALDHPVNAGFSYGTHVNNSQDAAADVYDFLQKFYRLYPHLSHNPFVIAAGSYGGVYVPNIAAVIHAQNKAIERGEGLPEARKIPLSALTLSNPFSDPLSHYRWLLYFRCELHQLYNETTCKEMYSILPSALDSVELAYQKPTLENRKAALLETTKLVSGDLHGHLVEDIRVICIPPPGDATACHPEFAWVDQFFARDSTRRGLGIPHGVNYTSFNAEVYHEFMRNADIIRPHARLYEPLLRDGIRILHYIGAQDASCAWPGVLSTLKLIDSPFQRDFIQGQDVPWPTSGVATVRAVGPGAGNFTYILVQDAGHFVINNQRALAKEIIHRFIDNLPWFE